MTDLRRIKTAAPVHIKCTSQMPKCGRFYVPNAEELGGWFAYPGNGQAENAQTSSGNGNSAGSATVVFGAKRQELVK